MCEGTAALSSGAISDAGSWTSRSKIWDVAGERCRGEGVAALRPRERMGLLREGEVVLPRGEPVRGG